MRPFLLTPVILVLAALASPAEAHAESYVLFKDCARDTLGSCAAPVFPGCEGSSGFGTVCYPASHIDPDWTGRATVTISDLVNHPIGVWACQRGTDLIIVEMLCGDDPQEYMVFGCGSLVLDIAMGWNPGRAITVFIGGPLLTLEQCATVGFGTTGSVTHN